MKAASRFPVPRGWNRRSMVCDRCGGRGWHHDWSLLNSARLCDFCHGAVKLSIGELESRLPGVHRGDVRHVLRRKRPDMGVCRRVITALVKAGALAP